METLLLLVVDVSALCSFVSGFEKVLLRRALPCDAACHETNE
jgi:hypothetical protein